MKIDWYLGTTSYKPNYTKLKDWFDYEVRHRFIGNKRLTDITIWFLKYELQIGITRKHKDLAINN